MPLTAVRNALPPQLRSCVSLVPVMGADALAATYLGAGDEALVGINVSYVDEANAPFVSGWITAQYVTCRREFAVLHRDALPSRLSLLATG